MKGTELVVDLVASTILVFVNGWLFMLAVDLVHNEWIHSLPTIGYWWAVLLVWLIKGLFCKTHTDSSKGKTQS